MRRDTLHRAPHAGRFFRILVVGLIAAASAVIITDRPVRGLSQDLVISQVYGGGGNSGAPYKNDFVEVFNRGTSAVSLAGKSIQYASATGTGNFSSNNVAQLSGTLQPGQYYLVQLAGGSTGVALPTPDGTGTVNMSGSAGKVALVNSSSGLACNGGSTACSPAQLALIIDLVGFGNANFYESSPTPALSNTTAAMRNGGGCDETDNNAADFTVGAPAPRNSATPLSPCGGSQEPTAPTAAGAATPSSLAAGESALLTVTVTPGAYPASSGITVVADLSAIGGFAAQGFFDDASNGDATAGDNVFSFLTSVSASTTPGPKSVNVAVSDAEGRTAATTITLSVVPPPMAIHDIQGSGVRSPWVGHTVITRGVVTARRYNNGFFIQTPDALADADPSTSEGIFVFTSVPPPAQAAVGAYVEVSGTAFEYVPTGSNADPYSPPVTEIVSPTVVALGTSYPMPTPVTLTAADLPTDGVPEQLERFEGMRVFVQSLRAVSATGGSWVTGGEPEAASTSNGTFYAVIEGTPRPFREPGIQVPDPLPAGAPPTVTRFDANPERLRVNSWGQVDATRFDVTTGALVSNTTGVLDYVARTYTILPDPSPTPSVSGGKVQAEPVPVPDVNEFTIASFNLERFYDDINDPGGDVALTPTAYQGRLNKASLSIRNVLLMPDIIGVEEVEKLSVLETLAAKINADAVAAGGPDPGYVARLEEGNDPGGIDVGFLVKSSRVDIVSVTQYGKDATYQEPDNSTSLLNDRPPLLLEAVVHGPLGSLPVTVIVNHLRSLNSIDDAADGARVRAKRLAQAEYLANLVQARQAADPAERIVLVGDFNAFEFSDGYVDVIGSVKGVPAPADSVVLTGSDLVTPDLVNLVETVPAAERYSYSFDGNAQVLDHVIANGRAAMRFSRLHYGRANADFPEAWRGVTTRPERLTDHDPAVAYFVFPDAPVITLSGANPLTTECCSAFTDPGATATDKDFGDLTASIAVSGVVDASRVGEYPLAYTVSNGYTSTTVTRVVKVVDTTPPSLTLTGANPMIVEVGSTFVDPGATASDLCAGPLDNSILVAGGVNASVVGTYQVTYSVSDGYNTTAVTRTVRVVDTTPPGLSAIVATPNTLWPPNHQMEKVRLLYTATDLGGPVACSIGVTSNETHWSHRRNRQPDWRIVSPTVLWLRAEREPWGHGRIYTIAVSCRDESGNTAVGKTTVAVPKSRGHRGPDDRGDRR